MFWLHLQWLMVVCIVQILSSLSEPGARTPHLLRTIEQQQTRVAERVLRSEANASLIDKIKAQFRVLPLLEINIPGFAVAKDSGRFVSARCPFHKDGKEKKPSMWIDLEGQLWGCHACGEHGDVINLYARLKNISNSEAISELGRSLP
jgi:hypothetical protein